MSLAVRDAWAIRRSSAALRFAYSQGGDILSTTLLIEPVLPRTCKPGVSYALLNGDLGISSGCHGAQVPGLVSISPYSPPFALLVQVPPVLVQTSSVLLGIPVSLHGKLDGLWEGFHGVAGWLWPAFGVVGSLERTGL